MAQIQKGTTYATGAQVTADNLNAHVDGAILLAGAINEQSSGTVFDSDNVLLAGTSALKKATLSQVKAGLIKADGSVAMTNHLQLASSSPPDALTAASKGYVDAQVSTSVAAANANADTRIARSGDTMSGALNLAGNASSALQAVPLQQLQSYANGTASLSTNGYQILPGGLILQWGTAISSSTKNFPIPFPNQVLSLVGNPTNPGGSYFVMMGNVINSGFIPTIRTTNNNIIAGENVSWIAIGR